MRFSRMKLKALVASVAAIAAIGVVGVSSAAASPAYWSNSGTMTWKGTPTLSYEGGSPKVCDFTLSGPVTAGTSSFSTSTDWVAHCNNELFQVTISTLAHYENGSAYLQSWSDAALISPFGWYSWSSKIPFVNPTKTTPAMLVFSNTPVSANGKLTLTGTVEVTVNGGKVLLA